MRSDTTTPESALPAADETVRLFDDWFDPIETGLRDRVREFIEGMIAGRARRCSGAPTLRPPGCRGGSDRGGRAPARQPPA